MLQTGIDGDQSVVLWYQPYWDIVKQILADTNAAPHMTYGFVPEHDPVTKERRYGGFCSAMWMEAAMREALAKDPDVTVVAVLVGSDATSIKNRDCAHPAYASLDNLSLPYRRGDKPISHMRGRLRVCQNLFDNVPVRLIPQHHGLVAVNARLQHTTVFST